ncbi:EAL domain-containing protein [Paractinoplanes atraurantiacus]|uniref:EAL domain, c-di-GMP-specific phosphodiesterase class I (Or its enzymatically inactive variant) n=1 Tax=Paractinoplanes atraurantiacus TaxID=1036182 RepID=A0A285K906_9ACTN|nr:EAL domain-containing protein [Actinoplanes atraurantiacus]SNY67801.1 EAL domain, c-di-GMP-specific phosphodiesterase class I (or its enzymatically inactive variant) [Actinoplanes atraurantiacus]
MPRTPADRRKPDAQRQWGADRRTEPHPIVPSPVSEGRITRGRLAIVVTITVWACYITYTIIQQFIAGHASSVRLGIEAIVYMLVVTGLAASAIAYLITRIGYFYRGRGHQRAPRIMLDEFIGGKTPSVTVLVPSYQEDERTNRTTLLSAALQEYPGLRVTLLIDDPRQPKTRAARDMLLAARALPGRIETELKVPYHHVSTAFASFDDQVRYRGGYLVVLEDMRRLADEYRFASDWLYDLGARQEMVDHTDTFFVEHILQPLAVELGQISGALHKGADEQVTLPLARMNQLYKRLLAIFDAQVTSFERKKYVSLSHEPNKAMNLNSYIGLMGGAYQEISTPMGTALVTAGPNRADLVVPDPDYVLTLDADSVLLPEYALRLVHLLEQGAYAQHAVAQTPYSAYPGSATRIERISGATTDIQYIVHQGMTHYGATFWVGANAVLRKKALDEICEVSYEGDWEIKRYIQDRTVIEDTESTIDLGVRGWSLHNYPERLAYSATPPDFGSLCIQRQRWANGGLLILSRLKDQFRAKSKREDKNRFGEYFLRVNYMASIFWSSVCLIVMLAYPFNNELLNPILLLVSVPYFLMMAADLKHLGYKRSDMLRIYGFNLILLPVNLSGSIASLLQLLTGEKSAFKRTPKVRDRTTAATSYLILPLALVALCVYTVVHDIQLHQWNNLVFAGLNLILSLYAMIAFVGLGNTVVDLWTHLRNWLIRPVTPKKTGKKKKAPKKTAPVGDWATVLHYRHEHGAAAGQTTVRLQRNDAGAWKTDKSSSSRAHSFEEFSFFTVFQPIYNMINGHVAGYEALTRFADGSNPREALEAAAERGVHVALDAALVQAAITSSASLPNGTWLAINVSADLLRRPHDLAPLLHQARRPLVLEVGAEAPAELSRLGGNVRVAVDDLGAGYETLSMVETLRPAFLKLGVDSLEGVEHQTARQAAIRALVEFAEQHGCTVIAEGIETAAQRDALVACGVPFGQGFYLGKPVPVERVLAGVGGW